MITAIPTINISKIKTNGTNFQQDIPNQKKNTILKCAKSIIIPIKLLKIAKILPKRILSWVYSGMQFVPEITSIFFRLEITLRANKAMMKNRYITNRTNSQLIRMDKASRAIHETIITAKLLLYGWGRNSSNTMLYESKDVMTNSSEKARMPGPLKTPRIISRAPGMSFPRLRGWGTHRFFVKRNMVAALVTPARENILISISKTF